MSDMSKVELLTEKDGHAVPGRMLETMGHHVFFPGEPIDTDEKVAVMCKFARRDRDGNFIPGTQVFYYVPSEMMEGDRPSARALRLVAERQGW